MLDNDTAMRLFDRIQKGVKTHPQPEFSQFYDRFLKSAKDYASIRLEWQSLDLSQRIERDHSRRVSHDAFISMLNAVCRNTGITDLDGILPDREAKGDFACYIAALPNAGQN